MMIRFMTLFAWFCGWPPVCRLRNRCRIRGSYQNGDALVLVDTVVTDKKGVTSQISLQEL